MGGVGIVVIEVVKMIGVEVCVGNVFMFGVVDIEN